MKRLKAAMFRWGYRRATGKDPETTPYDPSTVPPLGEIRDGIFYAPNGTIPDLSPYGSEAEIRDSTGDVVFLPVDCRLCGALVVSIPLHDQFHGRRK